MKACWSLSQNLPKHSDHQSSDSKLMDANLLAYRDFEMGK